MNCRFFILILIVFSIPLWNAACGDKCDMTGKTYHFQIPVSILNYNDTIKVGDTIKVLISYKLSAVLNTVNNKTENLENFKFFPVISILELINPNKEDFYSGLNKFKVFKTINSEWYFDKSGIYHTLIISKHNIINNEVKDTILFIPQYAGYFQLKFNSTNISYRGQTFPNKCPSSNYVLNWMNINKMEVENLNKYLYLSKFNEDLEFMNNSKPEFFSFGIYVKI